MLRPLCLSNLLLLSFFCLTVPESLYAFTPEKGMLLVAAEHLPDPRFHEGVILLIQNDAQGTAGLVINRESSLPLNAVLPEETHLPGPIKTLSYGGPLETQTLLALVKVRNRPPEPADEVLDGLYVTGVSVLAEWPEFKKEVLAYRAFSGYAGWAPGQLALELQHGDWQVMPGSDDAVFAGGGKDLWERLRKSLAEQKY
jgi:putative transcriptional regulator